MSKKKPPRAPKRTLVPIELEDRLTIGQVADLHRTFVARLAQGGALVIDGSRVEEIDTAMLQLLASLWRTSRERGIGCTWRGVSAALRETALLLGMAEMLHFPDGGPAPDGGHVGA